MLKSRHTESALGLPVLVDAQIRAAWGLEQWEQPACDRGLVGCVWPSGKGQCLTCKAACLAVQKIVPCWLLKVFPVCEERT